MDISPYIRVDINFCCLMYLVCTTFYTLSQLPKKSELTKLIRHSIYACMLGLIASTVEKMTHYMFPEKTSIVFMLYTVERITLLFIGYTWTMFIMTYVKRKEFDYKVPIYLMGPFIIGASILVLNIFIKNVFDVSTDLINYSIPGAFYIIYMISLHFYFIYSTIYLIINYKNMRIDDFKIFMVFNLAPGIGAACEIFFPQLILIWPFTSLAVMLAINYLEKNIVVFDNLTSAWTRTAFEENVEQLEKKGKEDFSIAFIDLDGFKLINDKFGHTEGDKALKTFSSVIRDILPKTSYLVRYGGDEFIVYIDSANRDVVYGIIGQISEAINKVNETTDKPYNINYTYSVETYNKAKHKTISNLIRTLDAEMYVKKNLKKNRLYKR